MHHRLQPDFPLPVFTTDGLRLYFYALTAHFGQWLRPEDAHKPIWQIAADFIYGQVREFQRRRLVKVERVMLWDQREMLSRRLKAAGLSGRLNTAFIERLNLTIRQGVAVLARRTLGAAQFTSELVWYVEWWRGYYRFARYHEALRVEPAVFRQPKARPAASCYRSQTAATLAPRWSLRDSASAGVATGLTSRRWPVLELISTPMN